MVDKSKKTKKLTLKKGASNAQKADAAKAKKPAAAKVATPTKKSAPVTKKATARNTTVARTLPVPTSGPNIPPRKDETSLKNAYYYGEPLPKTCQVSRTFYICAIIMTVLLYAEIVGGLLLYFNCDVKVTCDGPSLSQTVTQLLKGPQKRHHHHRDSGKIRRKRGNRRHKATETVKKTSAATINANELRKFETQACPPPATRRVVFNEEEYKPYAKGGDAAIEGKLCLPLADGSTKCYNNASVFINPVTSYSNEWYSRGWAGKENLTRADDRAFLYNVMVKTDENGNYTFTNLAPGNYYIGASVCVPNSKTAKKCTYRRYAKKVQVTKLIKVNRLDQVYP